MDRINKNFQDFDARHPWRASFGYPILFQTETSGLRILETRNPVNPVLILSDFLFLLRILR
jgi:hypothetical protein